MYLLTKTDKNCIVGIVTTRYRRKAMKMLIGLLISLATFCSFSTANAEEKRIESMREYEDLLWSFVNWHCDDWCPDEERQETLRRHVYLLHELLKEFDPDSEALPILERAKLEVDESTQLLKEWEGYKDCRYYDKVQQVYVTMTEAMIAIDYETPYPTCLIRATERGETDCRPYTDRR